MRIVQVSTQPTGGPVDHVADVAPVLAARGHDVTVLMPDGAAARRVEAAGVRRLPVASTSFSDVRGLAATVRQLRALRPDVVHSQDRRAGMVTRAAARVVRPAGLVYTLHGTPDSLEYLLYGTDPLPDPAEPERGRDKAMYLTAERALHHLGGGRVVTASRSLGRYVTDRIGVPASRWDLVVNGVDPSRFEPVERSPRDNMRACSVALMVPIKRPLNVVEAFAATDGLEGVLAGDGPLLAAVRGRIAALGVGDRVSAPGFVDDPARLVADSDVMVLGSDFENASIAILQAMAAGTPVVCTDVGGNAEMVTHGVTGLVVARQDPAALAAALTTLRDDPALRTRMGLAARADVEARFTLEHCVDGLEASYGRAVEHGLTLPAGRA